MKRVFSLLLILAITMTCAFAEQRGGPGGGRMGGGMTDKSGDAALQAMIAEVAPGFQLLTFEDANM